MNIKETLKRVRDKVSQNFVQSSRQNPYGLIYEHPQNIGQVAANIPGAITSNAVDVGREIARSVPALLGTLGNVTGLDKQTTIEPKGIERTIFGDEPIRTYKGVQQVTTPKVQRYVKSPTLAKGITGAGFVLGTLGNLVPGGSEEKAGLSELAQAGKTILPQVKKPVSEFNTVFKDFIGMREAAKTRATQVADLLNTAPKPMHSDIIRGLEGEPVHPDAQGFVSAFRQKYDELYTQARSAGVDLGYLDNYITHIWKKSPAEVAQLYQMAKQKFGFANNRTLPTYEEGVKIGLQPKYTNPAQIVGEYTRKLEEMKANVALVDNLKSQGLLVPPEVGMRQSGYKPVMAPGLPGHSYAPAEVVDKLNRIFSPESAGTVGKVAKIGAKISGAGQDILLSGGIPGTPVNAFTIAQMTKEIMGGRVKSPFVSAIRSISPGKSKEFFRTNAPQIIKMQEHGVPVTSNFDYETFGKVTGIKDVLGNIWNKAVNEPTFKRFMPMLHVNLFNDVERSLLQAGKNDQEASTIAAQAVKNFYGVVDTGTTAARSRTSQDVASTLLFAPRYRESMVNFWINNLKALRNPLAPENRNNLVFGASAVAAYVAMDQANVTFTGNHMFQNPKGKEDKLLIPLGNGQTIGVPFLSSIATVPRMVGKVAKDIYQGDLNQAGKELAGGLSVVGRPLADVAANENYFGKQIYDPNATGSDKYKAIGNYLLNPATGAYTHPYLREGLAYAQGKQGLGETLSKATELPLRFYDSKKLAMQPIWDDYFNQKKIKDIQSKLKYGKISPESASRQVTKLSGKGGLEPGQSVEVNGSIMYRTKDGYEFFDPKDYNGTYKSYKKIAGDENLPDDIKQSVLGSNDRFQERYAYEEQKPEFDAEFSLLKDRAKRSDSIDAWMHAAQVQSNFLESYRKTLDPKEDRLEYLKVTNALEDVLAEAEKYLGFGGFTKPKKPKVVRITRLPRAIKTVSRRPKRGRQGLSLTTPRVTKSKLAQGGL